jgi:hypothetical protein
MKFQDKPFGVKLQDQVKKKPIILVMPSAAKKNKLLSV